MPLRGAGLVIGNNLITFMCAILLSLTLDCGNATGAENYNDEGFSITKEQEIMMEIDKIIEYFIKLKEAGELPGLSKDISGKSNEALMSAVHITEEMKTRWFNGMMLQDAMTCKDKLFAVDVTGESVKLLYLFCLSKDNIYLLSSYKLVDKEYVKLP